MQAKMYYIIALSWGKGLGGRDARADLTNYNVSLFGIVTMNPLYNEYMVIEIKKKEIGF
jgi:hypothetical protein